MAPRNPVTEEQDEITTMADLMGGQREIEVDPVAPTQMKSNKNGKVTIRMNTTIEDFTYGDPHTHYKLEYGKRYSVPRNIASYLDSLGYVWH